MDMEHLWIKQEQSILDCGLMICSMVLGKRVGIMVKLSTMDSFTRAKRTERASFNGKMAAIMRETLSMDTFKAMENTILLIWTKFMRESSGCLQWKAEGRKYGQMGESMKVISRTGRRMVKGHLSGPMEINP